MTGHDYGVDMEAEWALAQVERTRSENRRSENIAAPPMTSTPSPEYRVHPDNPARIAARGCRTVGNPTFWIDLSAPGWRLTDEEVEGWIRLVPAPPAPEWTIDVAAGEGICDMCERRVSRDTLTSFSGFLALCPDCTTPPVDAEVSRG